MIRARGGVREGDDARVELALGRRRTALPRRVPQARLARAHAIAADAPFRACVRPMRVSLRGREEWEGGIAHRGSPAGWRTHRCGRRACGARAQSGEAAYACLLSSSKSSCARYRLSREWARPCCPGDHELVIVSPPPDGKSFPRDCRLARVDLAGSRDSNCTMLLAFRWSARPRLMAVHGQTGVPPLHVSGTFFSDYR